MLPLDILIFEGTCSNFYPLILSNCKLLFKYVLLFVYMADYYLRIILLMS